MKPYHFAKKYNLAKGVQFNHTKFAMDFGNDFNARLELYKSYNNWNHVRFLDLLDEAKKIWDNIDNKTAGNLPEKLWNYIYYNILLPTKDKEFPEIAKEERRIDAMNIIQLKSYLKAKLQLSITIDDAKMEWDNYGSDTALGALQIRPNISLKLLERDIDRTGDYFDSYAFEELYYQLSKQGHAYAKVQFNIFRQRKNRSSFDWYDFSVGQMYNFFNEREYDPYFELLGVKKGKETKEADVMRIYRQLAMTHHPDKGGSQEKFIEITEAKNKCVEYCRIISKQLVR